MIGRRPKAWELAHPEDGGRVGPRIVWPEDEWGSDIMGTPATQPCQLAPATHTWSDLIITNPWYLWFRPIRGVLACSCEVACDGTAAVYGMVGGSFGSAPFFACRPHWAWLGRNHHIVGGHSGAVLGVGNDSLWGGVSQNYDSAWQASDPAPEGSSDEARRIGPNHRRTFNEWVATRPVPECHRGRRPGAPACSGRLRLAANYSFAHAGSDGVMLVVCPGHWAIDIAEPQGPARSLRGWWDGQRWHILGAGEEPPAEA